MCTIMIQEMSLFLEITSEIYKGAILFLWFLLKNSSQKKVGGGGQGGHRAINEAKWQNADNSGILVIVYGHLVYILIKIESFCTETTKLKGNWLNGRR